MQTPLFCDYHTHMESDPAVQSLQDQQNVQACNYQTYYPAYTHDAHYLRIATAQPGILVSGHDALGTHIDDASTLLLGARQTKHKGRIDLFPRTFATIPFLGRGAVAPDVESELVQGTQQSAKKTHTLFAETQDAHNITPLHTHTHAYIAQQQAVHNNPHWIPHTSR